MYREGDLEKIRDIILNYDILKLKQTLIRISSIELTNIDGLSIEMFQGLGITGGWFTMIEIKYKDQFNDFTFEDMPSDLEEVIDRGLMKSPYIKSVIRESKLTNLI